jgi:hypothetical protein
LISPRLAEGRSSAREAKRRPRRPCRGLTFYRLRPTALRVSRRPVRYAGRWDYVLPAPPQLTSRQTSITIAEVAALLSKEPGRDSKAGQEPGAGVACGLVPRSQSSFITLPFSTYILPLIESGGRQNYTTSKLAETLHEHLFIASATRCSNAKPAPGTQLPPAPEPMLEARIEFTAQTFVGRATCL